MVSIEALSLVLKASGISHFPSTRSMYECFPMRIYKNMEPAYGVHEDRGFVELPAPVENVQGAERVEHARSVNDVERARIGHAAMKKYCYDYKAYGGKP